LEPPHSPPSWCHCCSSLTLFLPDVSPFQFTVVGCGVVVDLLWQHLHFSPCVITILKLESFVWVIRRSTGTWLFRSGTGKEWGGCRWHTNHSAWIPVSWALGLSIDLNKRFDQLEFKGKNSHGEAINQNINHNQ
jgi:hypothetical protein